MTKLRLLAFLAAVLPLLLFPAIASAQAELPHAFYGSASVDGVNAATGTTVSALIDGKSVATASYTGTRYALTVSAAIGSSYKDKTITFKVGTATATQTAKQTPGEVTNLNLTATTVPPGPATVKLTPSTGLISTVSGTNFTPGSAVSVTSDTTTLATATADGKGAFSAVIVAPTTKAGTVSVKATDSAAKSATGTLTVPDLTGPAGAAGKDGAAGKAGAAGPAGKAGAAGSAGSAGPAGKAGADGKAGPTGPAGATGPAGKAGPEGKAGQPAPVAILWIALVIAIVAIVLAVLGMARKPKAA